MKDFLIMMGIVTGAILAGIGVACLFTSATGWNVQPDVEWLPPEATNSTVYWVPTDVKPKARGLEEIPDWDGTKVWSPNGVPHPIEAGSAAPADRGPWQSRPCDGRQLRPAAC